MTENCQLNSQYKHRTFLWKIYTLELHNNSKVKIDYKQRICINNSYIKRFFFKIIKPLKRKEYICDISNTKVERTRKHSSFII